MSFRSACGPTLVGLHLLLRMATPLGRKGVALLEGLFWRVEWNDYYLTIRLSILVS